VDETWIYHYMLQRQNSPNKNYQRGTCKEDEDYSFGREGYGNRLLRFARNSPHRLYEKG